ncbi:hypothetical protein PHMEG_00023374, partial [Phytophthora megakarya]
MLKRGGGSFRRNRLTDSASERDLSPASRSSSDPRRSKRSSRTRDSDNVRDSSDNAKLKKKRGGNQSDSGSTSDIITKRKNRPKRNVRNSFSWGINKAFARKQSSKNGNRNSTIGKRPAKDEAPASSEASSSEEPRRKVVSRRRKEANSSSSDNQNKQRSKVTRRNVAAKRSAALTSTESEQEETGRERSKRRESRMKRVIAHSEDEVLDEDAIGLDQYERDDLGETKLYSVVMMTTTMGFPITMDHRLVLMLGSFVDAKKQKDNEEFDDEAMRKVCLKDDNNGSSSGLDVGELRRRQKAKGQRRIRRRSYAKSVSEGKTDDDPEENSADGSENSENEDGGEEWSRSDEEYHKHLKRSLRRAFDFFDLDQTSTIDKRELSHVLRALGHEFTSKELDAEMSSADLDRNGQLDFYEFVAFVKKQLAQKTYLLSQQREMEIRQSFQALDRDKNGALDEHEFEYLIYKVLQVELSIEEQDALLDFVDKDADGLISEEEFIIFMKKLETLHRKYSGKSSWKKQKLFLDSLDTTSQLAYSAMKKLVRGVPMDIDRSLLMFFGIPSNFRPAISSAATCRTLRGNTMEHVLSFPSPQTIEALALDTRFNDKKDSSWFSFSWLDTNSEEYRMLQQAEGVEAQAIVSLKRAAGVPKPFDTREDDVVKRCVHVCLFQEQEVSEPKVTSSRRRNKKVKTKSGKGTSTGTVVGNVHEIPVYWHQGEEDVWEFSKRATKQDKYKFLVRTNTVNDHLYLLVEFIVHLKINPEEHVSTKRSKRRKAANERDDSDDDTGMNGETREMVCCWCKIPVRQLLAKRSDILRRKEKLWGGTAIAPVDIEQDELLRRRTGWRAFTNMFTKPSPPLMGIKSVPIDALAEDLQLFVRKMPPVVIAPFVSLPILAEYMAVVRSTLACVASSSSVMTCEPALKLLPKIVDDHDALPIFRKAFDSEVATMKPGE